MYLILNCKIVDIKIDDLLVGGALHVLEHAVTLTSTGQFLMHWEAKEITVVKIGKSFQYLNTQ